MKINKIFAVSCLALASSTASAAIITQNGNNVSFTYDDATAYGTGNVVGDVIFFTPTTFLAQSLDGAGIDATTATLNIDVTAITTGFSMTSFSLAEEGDYKLSGSGASVSADGYFAATSLTTNCGLPPCRDTTIFDAGTLNNSNGLLNPWNMGGTLNLADVAGWGSDTSVRLTIQNNLAAETLATGEIAFIQKKFSVSIPQVPVPAAVWLFASGLIGLMGVARRKA